jgi:hypothetical protein
MHSELSQFVQEWNLRGVSVGKCPTATMDAVPAAVPPNRSQSDLLQRDVATYHQFPKNSGPKNSGPKNSGPKNSGPKNSGPKNSGPKNSGPKNSGPVPSHVSEKLGDCPQVRSPS